MNFRFLYNLLLIVVFTSCTNNNNPVSIESTNKDLELVNGILELNKVPFSGILTTHFYNGNLNYEICYLNGKKDGREKHWFENGSLAQERFYINGFKSGIHRAWWDSQHPKFVYHFNDKGEFNGEVKEWYRSGRLYMSFNYENGKEVGSQKLWKSDGTIKANYEVVNGERFGLIGLKKCYNISISMVPEIIVQNR